MKIEGHIYKFYSNRICFLNQDEDDIFEGNVTFDVYKSKDALSIIKTDKTSLACYNNLPSEKEDFLYFTYPSQKVIGGVVFPKLNTKFVILDFFQIDVDEFKRGYFRFLSAKIVKPILNENLKSSISLINDFAYIISVYCYTNKSFDKILVCEWTRNDWTNSYKIASEFASINGCDYFAENHEINLFLSSFVF